MTAPDEDYLIGHAHEQQAAAHRAAYEDPCPAGCRHRWHGLTCDTFGCDCPSSYRGQA